MSYPIERIKLHWGTVPVDLRFSYGTVEKFDFLVVRLWSGGFEGVGEALLIPNGFMNEYIPTLLGCDACGLDSLLPRTNNDCDRVRCEAVSIALHDLVGKMSGLALHVLLGGKKRSQVPLMPCIFPNSAEDAGRLAQKFYSKGYESYLKVKLMGQLSEDVARVKSIRKIVPDSLVLQGDANCGYTRLEEATRAVRALGDAGLDIIEDPLQGGVKDYCELRKAGCAKIMVDALARRGEDLLTVLRHGAADVIGIHPDQPGSLSQALFHSRLAQEFGVPVVVGGTGYPGVGTAAYMHLTAVATEQGPCGELGGGVDHGMPTGLVQKPFLVKDGQVEIPDDPGLGVELDLEALSLYEQGSKEWLGKKDAVCVDKP